jgi:hypothetical protein
MTMRDDEIDRPTVRVVTDDERERWVAYLDACWSAAPWRGTGEHPIWAAVVRLAVAAYDTGEASADGDHDAATRAHDRQMGARAEVRRLLGLPEEG